jgi:hypothetical protein
MPLFYSSKAHKCPPQAKNHQYREDARYGRICVTHQEVCEVHEQIHLKTEDCPTCKKAEQMRLKKEKEDAENAKPKPKTALQEFLDPPPTKKKPDTRWEE